MNPTNTPFLGQTVGARRRGPRRIIFKTNRTWEQIMDLIGFYSIVAYNSQGFGLKDNDNSWEKKPKLDPTDLVVTSSSSLPPAWSRQRERIKLLLTFSTDRTSPHRLVTTPTRRTRGNMEKYPTIWDLHLQTSLNMKRVGQLNISGRENFKGTIFLSEKRSFLWDFDRTLGGLVIRWSNNDCSSNSVDVNGFGTVTSFSGKRNRGGYGLVRGLIRYRGNGSISFQPSLSLAIAGEQRKLSHERQTKEPKTLISLPSRPFTHQGRSKPETWSEKLQTVNFKPVACQELELAKRNDNRAPSRQDFKSSSS